MGPPFLFGAPCLTNCGGPAGDIAQHAAKRQIESGYRLPPCIGGGGRTRLENPPGGDRSAALADHFHADLNHRLPCPGIDLEAADLRYKIVIGADPVAGPGHCADGRPVLKRLDQARLEQLRQPVAPLRTLQQAHARTGGSHHDAIGIKRRQSLRRTHDNAGGNLFRRKPGPRRRQIKCRQRRPGATSQQHTRSGRRKGALDDGSNGCATPTVLQTRLLMQSLQALTCRVATCKLGGSWDRDLPARIWGKSPVPCRVNIQARPLRRAGSPWSNAQPLTARHIRASAVSCQRAIAAGSFPANAAFCSCRRACGGRQRRALHTGAVRCL